MIRNRISDRRFPRSARSINPENTGIPFGDTTVVGFAWWALTIADPTDDLIKDIHPRTFPASCAILIAVKSGNDSMRGVVHLQEFGHKIIVILTNEFPSPFMSIFRFLVQSAPEIRFSLFHEGSYVFGLRDP
jgi:hypothetical protein